MKLHIALALCASLVSTTSFAQMGRRGGGQRANVQNRSTANNVNRNNNANVNRNYNNNTNVNRNVNVNQNVNVNRNVNVNVNRTGAWVRPSNYYWRPGGAIA